MSVKLQELLARADNKCELCASTENLNPFDVDPSDGSSEQAVLLCANCSGQIEDTNSSDSNHWRCLNDSMWSQVPAVQVMAWRQLKELSNSGESWASDLLDMMYMEPETQTWAEATQPEEEDPDTVKHFDSNGTRLAAGDSVVLIKDLPVKGGGFTAKRGYAVRNIGLTTNPEHIEGRVESQRIVILTKFVKKM